MRCEQLDGVKLDSGQQAYLYKRDVEVILSLMELEEVDEVIIHDDVSQSLRKWWWRLGKLRHKTYPADLLPGHLRAVYREYAKIDIKPL